jgi:hypothetical protein
VADAPPSPVAALNRAALARAKGENALIAIDGARIFSDRLVANVLRAHAMLSDALVYTLACHIGPKVQMDSTKEGYDAAVEDRLIAASGWPQRPEGLYEISVLAGSSKPGFFKPVSESNAFSLPRSLLTRHGGYDQRFVSPGAGLANLELFARYATLPAARNICLLSDVTFHQVHGGIATSGKGASDDFKAEYQAIFGRPYARPGYEMLHLGPIRPEVLRLMPAQ